MVAITWSSDTWCEPSPRHRDRAALIAFTPSHGIAFDAGDLHQSGDRIAGQPRLCSMPDFGGILDLFVARR